MKENSTLNVLGCITSLLILSACSTQKVEPVTTVEVRTVEVKRPAPIVPAPDQLKLRDVSWIVVTADNIDNVLAKTDDKVLFALTDQGYENLALNMSDIRASIEQHKRIIAIYKSQF